jgi:uncharacterized protein
VVADQCDCDACPDLSDSDAERRPIEVFQKMVRLGIVRDLNLNHDAFLTNVREYTVALGSHAKQVVALDSQAAELLSTSLFPATLQDLAVEFRAWPTAILEEMIALLLAVDVLSAPSAKPHVTPTKPKLSAWLHLTNRCNLACPYCYVPQNGLQMDVATARRAVAAIFRSAQAHNYSYVKLKYAGGEPTLNFDALLAAQVKAAALSAQTGINLESAILTNGVHLTNAQMDSLVMHRIQIMVSLDGVDRYQDVQRPPKRGAGGSFKMVACTLARLCQRGISPHISITITKKNLDGLPSLVEYLLDRELRFSFNFYREPSCTSQSDGLSPTNAELIEGLQQAYSVIERKLPSFSLLQNLADRANLQTPHLHTCGVGQHYMVIDCLGNVAKCQMDLAHPSTTIDVSDPLGMVREDSERIQSLSVDRTECRTCKWRYRCAGGCPRLTYQRTGRYDARSPMCSVYRAILPQVVQLEGLRLLTHEEPWSFVSYR